MVEATFRLLLGEHPQVLAVSEGVEALLGFKPEDFLSAGVHLQDRIHPRDSEIAGKLFSAEDWNGSGGFNIRLRHADGHFCRVSGQCAKQTGPGVGLILHLTLRGAKHPHAGPHSSPDERTHAARPRILEADESLREAHTIAGLGSYALDVATGAWSASDVLDGILGIGKDYDRTDAGWRALIHPDDRAEIPTSLANALQDVGAPFSREFRITRQSDGAERWVHGLGRVECDAQGRPAVLRGTIQDITERRQTEAALRESRELLQLFIQHAPAALAMFDREMRYLAASRRWVESHGLAGQELIGRCHYDIFTDLPESWKQTHRRALAGEATEAGEDSFRRPDGNVMWVRRKVHPWFTGSGAIGGIILFAEDITREKQADERLHLAANVFTHASEGILITDANGSILDVNEAFTRITGYSREEVLGDNPRLLRSGRYSSEFYAGMWNQLIEQGNWSGEIWNRAKNGRIYAENLTITAVPDESGKPRQYVAMFSDITSIKEQERKLEHVTHYDLLTGLPNRTLLADRLHQAMAHAHRRGRMMAIVCLDLDNFKAINDRHGHNVGDQLLTALTRRVSLVLREGDTLARLGGDEFAAVLLELSGSKESTPLITRLLRATSEPVQVGELTLPVSASLGVTFFPQTDDVDADQLLRQAGQAMYHAKLEGKNRYHIFDPRLDRSMRGHHEDLGRIRQALEASEFVLHFQPRVNMSTGAILGAEALIRWQHPEQGLVLPAQFLPVVEGDPLAIDIGEWVIRNALSQMERWRAEGLDIPISVNIAAHQLQQDTFVQRLQALLAEHPGIAPSSLEMEVLESSALQDIAQVSEVIRACSRLGISFALDDFGTGYSSLSYLKRLPVDVLKIDQSFVHDMLDDPEDLAILEGVLGLATAFRRRAIAEGVETVDHGLMLLRLGCQLAQGYGIARPMPADELPAWAASWRPHPRWINVAPAAVDDWPLLHAGVEHRAWVAGVEDFLKGLRHKEPPLDHRECKFGLWLLAEAQTQRGRLSAFEQMNVLHQQMHALGAELVALKTQGQAEAALARLAELHELRGALFEKLNGLQSHHNQGLPR
ncbi:MAG: EAL domain-containing protein [Acidobacteriota bacterium]|nr:EAL domain-containing protein [Acidobacteriota bacterium]